MMQDKNYENNIEISVIMPCLNEEKAVGICVEKCFRAFDENNIKGEVIVIDNGSTDKSREIALKAGAKLVEELRRGYGSAYLRGFSEAGGKYLLMADADNTYDFLEIPNFIKQLRKGYDFVIGTRLKGDIANGKGTMPWTHRYIGNPVLTFILKSFFKIKVSDVYCGMRAMTRDAYDKLFLRTTGMEFALEMVINTKKAKLRVKEVPINYGLRMGESKLRTVKDGWRSLRFMLLYSPKFLFIVPGAILFIIGTAILLALASGPLKLGNMEFNYHYMFLGSIFAIMGYQVINLGLFTKVYSYSEKFEDEKKDKIMQFIFKNLSLERIIIIGAVSFLSGLFLLAYVVYLWTKKEFGELFEIQRMILSLTFIILGIQTIFNGFFFSILRIEKR
jgi:glycosyltransferase involved in cell wall biosynthesis